MEPELEDPSDWSVEGVVQFLCHNPETPWSQSTSQAPRPDPLTFERALRENMITGEVLLQDVDKQVLRENLGLQAFGHVSSILMAIRYLRCQSIKYQESHAAQFGDNSSLHGSSRFTSTPGPVPEFSSPTYQTLSRAATPQRLLGSGMATPIGPAVPPSKRKHPRDSIESGKNSLELSRPNENANTDGSMVIHRSAEAVPKSSGDCGLPRNGEHYIFDDKGKKRRRLDLRALIKSSSENAAEPKNPSEKSGRYMPACGVNPSQLFYPIETEDSERSFVMVGSDFPPAQRAYVKSCMQYFYQQKASKLSSDDGSERWALVPYKHSSAKKDTSRPFTLYTSRNGDTVVSEENSENWPELGKSNPDIQPQALDASDPMYWLLKKYPVEDESQSLVQAYPVYGDSGSEGEYDEETWQEIHDEQQEALHQELPKLTPDEVKSVVAQSVKDFENQWHAVEKPKEERKAWRLWTATRRDHFTNQRIQYLSHDIGRLETRLKKIQEAILEADYASKAELVTQCPCMEHTIREIQKQKWRISILEMEDCPRKPAPQQRPPRKPKQKLSAPGDDESLHSETDDDDIDDFIDDSGMHINGPMDVDTPMDIDTGALHQPGEHRGESQTQASSSESEAEGDAISPSGIRRKSTIHRRVPLRTSSPSSTESVQDRTTAYVDLTLGDSPPPEDQELTIETPPLNPTEPSQFPDVPPKTERDSVSPAPGIGSAVSVDDSDVEGWDEEDSDSDKQPLPDVNDFEQISSLDWDELEERRDRRRLLAKLICCLPTPEREMLTDELPEWWSSELADAVIDGCQIMLGNQKREDLEDENPELVMRATSLFISWINCVHLDRSGIKRTYIKEARRSTLAVAEFYDEICNRLMAYRLWDKMNREARDFQAVEDETPAASGTPRKKGKKAAKESKAAKVTQGNAQIRAALQAKQRERLEQKLASMGVGNDDPDRQAVSFEDPVIYLDPHIGKRVKPHQLNGIQFMWRELIKDEKEQGCLLAHTMGLGKTMQVISLLCTISIAASSEDPLIRRQIPARFERSQTLVLCPSSLIDNWYEEFLMWIPEAAYGHLGQVRKITSSIKPSQRMEEACTWNRDGGVLIMSYDIFRNWVLNNSTKTRGPRLSPEEHKNVKEWLLERPNIVVADESHKLKNSDTGIYQAAEQVRTQSRISMTGSPLSNDLDEYYTAVDWAAPGYLGDFNQFWTNYVEPIEAGLYADSDHRRQRACLMKLQVLKEILAPKINRADISVIVGDLPPKVEFVLTIPLTALQTEAYNLYVNYVWKGQSIGNATLWSWLTHLSLCCKHPAVFRDKLLDKKGEKTNKDVEEAMPGDEPITESGIEKPEQLIDAEMQIFANVPDIEALELSYRAVLLKKIVDESVKAGDRVLVFSHSLPTLTYIEHILQISNHKYCRLDGSTPISIRQAAIKSFNHSNSPYSVYLISTRAGGLGLNITGANRVIIFDFTWSPMWEEQAVARAYRLGQTKPVFVYRFLAGGTFEERVNNTAVFKTQLASRVVEKKKPIRLALSNPGTYLFEAKTVKQQDVSEYLGKDPHVLDKILREDTGEERMIRSIALTETFQKEEDSDDLTEEERREVQRELEDELLKRKDPAAYKTRMEERRKEEGARRHKSSSPEPIPQPRRASAPAPPARVQASASTPQVNMPHRVNMAAHPNGPPQANVPAHIAQASMLHRANMSAPFTQANMPPQANVLTQLNGPPRTDAPALAQAGPARAPAAFNATTSAPANASAPVNQPATAGNPQDPRHAQNEPPTGLFRPPSRTTSTTNSPRTTPAPTPSNLPTPAGPAQQPVSGASAQQAEDNADKRHLSEPAQTKKAEKTVCKTQ